MDQLPIFITPHGRRCLVIGGGEAAATKTTLLCKARVTVGVIAPQLCPALAEQHQAGAVAWIPSAFEPGHLDNAALVIAATDDAGINQAISVEARKRNLPVNVVDQPDLSTFSLPAIAEQWFFGQPGESYHDRHPPSGNQPDARPKGEVYLVGGGPGDPDLLTLRAMRLMQQADVVLYDALVSERIVDMVRRDAERIYVGKRSSNHSLPQEEINNLLVALAKTGKRVLRLKGGDPFIFGRGGEEIDTLAAHGIPFQVVPGISAANGVSSYAGIPLTHRDYAQSVLFATGHLRDDMVELDWIAMTRPHQTVVIYMGLGKLAEICRKLIEHGAPATMPAAVVQQGTTRHQRVVAGTLSTLPALVEAAGLKSPSLTIVGEVVKLREKLAWFVPEKEN